MDILPPKKKQIPPPIAMPTIPEQRPLTPPPAPLSPYKHPFRRNNKRWVFYGIAAAIFVCVVAALSWYGWALRPLDTESTAKVRIVVESGDSASRIADQLKTEGVVRSATAVKVYNEIHGTKHKLQAGGYVLSPSQSVEEIMTHIINGKTDEFEVTILPGLTLEELADPGVKGSLAQQGFSKEEITEALNASYDSPLFADKPASATLEGYVFPETYRMSADGKLSTLFARSFDELYARLQSEGMIEKFKQRNLTLYQALTLASIIQMEEPDPDDQKQVAQVFLLRLDKGMALESDPTFFYAAKQLGREPTVDIDSPYNTRKYAGLPPGPIANMNYSAIQALAVPASGDYLYFVAGDDGATRFSHTLAEHIENIKKYCHDLCS